MNYIHETFARVVARFGSAPAIESSTGLWTYTELDLRSNAVANALSDLRDEEIVGVYTESCPEYVLGILGVLKAGGAYLPLNPLLPANRIGQLVNDASVNIVLTNRKNLRKARMAFPSKITLIVLDELPSIGQKPPLHTNQLAYIIYTSGSTGRPKGVAVEHNALVALAQNRAFGINESDVFCQLTPIHADPSGFEIWGALLNGAKLTIPSEERLGIRDIADHISTFNVTVMRLVAPLFAAFVESHLSTMSGLRLALSGGDRASLKAIKSVLQSHPNCTVVNAYGPTETTIMACCHFMKSCDDTWRSVPIGYALDGVEVLVLDESMQPAASGELFIGGVGLARGYIGQPELTAANFITINGQIFYRTGDSVQQLNDGSLEFLGRKDRQVKIRGYRVEPLEIENAIASCDDVLEAAVIVKQGNIVGFARFRGHPRCLKSELADFIPSYMIPQQIVPIDDFPKLPNGKIDRVSLQKLSVSEVEGQQPSNAIEIMVADIWCEVLGRNTVPIDVDLFQLGGHSLALMRIIAKIESKLNVCLPISLMFHGTTVTHMVKLVEKGGSRTDLPQTSTSRAPLLFGQEGMLFEEKLTPNLGRYRISRTFDVNGPLSIHSFQQAVEQIIRRQQALNISIVESDDGQEMVVMHDRPAFISVVNIDEKHQDEHIKVLVSEFSQKTMDLTKEAPLRILVIKTSETRHVIHIDLHHIVADDWSLDILFQELSEFYCAHLEERIPNLQPLSATFLDFAKHDPSRELALYNEADNGWSRLLGGYPGAINLIYDYARTDLLSGKGDHENLTLDNNTFKKIVKICKSLKVTPFVFVLTAVYLVLSKYSHQSDICLATATAGRQRAGMESLIGYFVKVLPIRINPESSLSIAELLRDVALMCSASYALEDKPVDNLTRENVAQLFQVAVTYQQEPPRGLSLAHTKISQWSKSEATAKFELGFSFEETLSGLTGTIEYSTDLFMSDSIQQLAIHLKNTLRWMTINEQALAADVAMADKDELRQVMNEWNRTDNYPTIERCLHELVSEQAMRSPSKIAIKDDIDALTYSELDKLSDRIAATLIELGVQMEDRVAVCIERSPQLTAYMLGIMKAGAVYIPIDPAYPAARISQILSDATPIAIITSDNLRESLLTDKVLPPTTTTLMADDFCTVQGKFEKITVCPNNLAYIIYTSGSTGKPKGVAVEHHGVANTLNAHIQLCGFKPTDVFTQFAAAGFDMAIYEQLIPLTCGATSVICSDELKHNGRAWADFVNKHAITVQMLTPAFLRSLDRPAMPSIRWLLSGGEAADLSDAKYYARHTSFLNAYGPTEASMCMASYVCTGDEIRARVPIGRPLANTKAYVLDHHQRPCPICVPGELWIGGVGLARGYVNDETLTASRFKIVDSVGSGRLYRTGDKVRWLPDSNLDYLGRLDDQVKIRGHRIELGEIDTVGGRHPKVAQFCTIKDKQSLAGFFVGTATEKEIRAFIAKRLPSYMVPGVITAVDKMPMTAHDKVDRHALLALRKRRKCEREQINNETGVKLARIWENLLGVKEIGLDDDFFELGGHSLLTVRLLAKIEQETGVQVSLRQFLSTPTIRGLLMVISGEVSSDVYVAVQPLSLTMRSSTKNSTRPLKPKHVMLTGATGFVGAHILQALIRETEAHVVCLVRAASKDAAAARLADTMKSWNLDHVSLTGRVSLLPGDLAAPRLGLSQEAWRRLEHEIDMIINAGAFVHHASNLARLERTNVDSVRQLLELATNGIKFMHVSTLAVYDSSRARVISEYTGISTERHPVSKGYSASKWVADQMVMRAAEFGVDCQIFRIGRASGSSETGTSNSDDFLSRLLLSCIELGVYPDDRRLNANIVPVDYTARGIVMLAMNSQHQVHHIHHHSSTPLSFFFDVLEAMGGKKVLPATLNEWLDLWGTCNLPILPYRPMLIELAKSAAEVPVFNNVATLSELETLGVLTPTIDHALIEKYWQQLQVNKGLKSDGTKTYAEACDLGSLEDIHN